MRLGRVRRCAAAAALALMLAAGAPGDLPARQVSVTLAESGERERVELREFGDAPYLRLADLARIAKAPRHWNPGSSKMALSLGGHRVAVTPDNQFVRYDAEILNVHRPALLRDGELWVPEAFLDTVLGPAAEFAFEWSEDGGELVVTRRPVVVDSVFADAAEDVTTVAVLVSRLPEFGISTTAGDEITLSLEGAALEDTLATVAPVGLVTGVTAAVATGGLDIVIGVSGAAATFSADGYHSPERIEVAVRGGRFGGVPEPDLRDEKHVAPPVAPFGGSRRGLETVMIDPGHGGRDSGATGSTGLLEKDVNLALARKLSRELRDRGFLVFMTRNSDSAIPVQRRAEIANLAEADLLLSIQCDAARSGSASGTTVLYYRPPDEEGTPFTGRQRPGLRFVQRGARSEAADELLWKRMQERYLGESRTLARTVGSALRAEMPDRDRGVAGRDLALLAGCAMPAILVEVGFITNREDESLLADESFQSRIADTIAAAIDDYGRSLERSDQ